MIQYSVWFDLAGGVGEANGLAEVRALLDEMQQRGAIAGFQLLANTSAAGESARPAYQAQILFADEAQMTAAFAEQERQGIHTGQHGRVIPLVGNFSASTFRTIDQPQATNRSQLG